MPNLNVTYQEMRDTGNRLTAGQMEIDAKLSELASLVDNLVNQGFATDTASGAFRDSYTEFTTGARQVIGGLEGMRGFLFQAADTFENADSTLAAGIRR